MRVQISGSYGYLIWIPPMAIWNDLPMYWNGNVTYTDPVKPLMTLDIRLAQLFRSYPVADFLRFMLMPELGTVKTLTVRDRQELGLIK